LIHPKKITFFLDISKIFITLLQAIIKIRKTEKSRPLGAVQEKKENLFFLRKWESDVVANQKSIALPFS
jgi:hypothetical protein